MKIEHVQVLGVDKKVKVNAGHFSNALYDTYLNMSVDVELTDPYIIHGYVKSATSGSITISVGNDSSTYTTKNEWLEVIMKISKISSQEINFIFSKGEYWIYNWKLEKGSNETAWTPSPLDAKFDLVQLGSEVTQLSNKIEQKVWQTDIDTASKTINKSVSLVGQDAKKIYWLIDENSKTQASMSLTKNVYSLIAENIDLTGKVTFSCFDSSVQKRVTDVEGAASNAQSSANAAQSTANSATSAANNAQNTADGIIKNIYVTNKTTINGGKIETGTVTADAIATDAIISKNYVKDSAGSFFNLTDGTFDSKNFKIDSSGNVTVSGKITASSGTISNLTIAENTLSRTQGLGLFSIAVDASTYEFRTQFASDKSVLSGGKLKFYKNDSLLTTFGAASSSSNDDTGIAINTATGSKYFVLSVNGNSRFIINNGLNPDGITTNVIISGSTCITGGLYFEKDGSYLAATSSHGIACTSDFTISKGLTVGNSKASTASFYCYNPNNDSEASNVRIFNAEKYYYNNCELSVFGSARFKYNLYCESTIYGEVSSDSDENIKKDIKALDINESANFIYNITPSEYRFKNGTSNRLHHGFIAQRVKETMRDNDWGLFVDKKINNENYETKIINEDGNTIKSLTARYGLRYDEFIADIVATLQSQNIRIKELEKQLNK